MATPALTRVARSALVLTAVLVAILGGCTTAGDRSGSPGDPTVLILANNDLNGLVGAPGVARFVDRVAQLSGGKLTIRVSSSWRGGGISEAGLIRDVASGRADLGWAGTRAFDRVGIDVFQPLHAPFLITSYAAEAAVLRDRLAGELLGQLTPHGLTGLALIADELRMPAGPTPLLSPQDFRGKTIRTFDSAIQAEGLRALGARPAVRDGAKGFDGVETMWQTYLSNGQSSWAPYVTANAVLWPRSAAIFSNSRRFAALGPQGRRWLRRAAEDAAAWAAGHAGARQAAQMAQVCQAGARIELATADQLAALRAAAQPVYARLRADERQAPVLARIEALVQTTRPPPDVAVPDGCAYHPGDPPPYPAPPLLTGPGQAGSLPQGIYRYTLTYDELRAHGINDPDARANAAVFTFTLRAGRWRYDARPLRTDIPAGYAGNTCAGWYDVHGTAVDLTRVTEYPSGECAPKSWSMRWATMRGGLRVRPLVDPETAYIFGGKTWRRIS